MPGPEGLPTGAWEEAETREMEEVVGLCSFPTSFTCFEDASKLAPLPRGRDADCEGDRWQDLSFLAGRSRR